MQGSLLGLLTFSRCIARRIFCSSSLNCWVQVMSSPSPLSSMTAPRASPMGWLCCRNTGRHRVCRIIDVRFASARQHSISNHVTNRQSVCSEVLFTDILPPFHIFFPVREMLLEVLSALGPSRSSITTIVVGRHHCEWCHVRTRINDRYAIENMPDKYRTTITL